VSIVHEPISAVLTPTACMPYRISGLHALLVAAYGELSCFSEVNIGAWRAQATKQDVIFQLLFRAQMKHLADTAIQKWEQHAAAMACAEGEEDAQARQARSWPALTPECKWCLAALQLYISTPAASHACSAAAVCARYRLVRASA
jgi:hypothetical protein